MVEALWQLLPAVIGLFIALLAVVLFLRSRTPDPKWSLFTNMLIRLSLTEDEDKRDPKMPDDNPRAHKD